MPANAGQVLTVTAARPEQLIGVTAVDPVLIYNLDPTNTIYLSSNSLVPASGRAPIGPGKQILWPQGTPCYAIAQNLGTASASVLVLEGGGGMQPSALEIATLIGTVPFAGNVDVLNFAELRGAALRTLTDIVNAINNAAAATTVANLPATLPVSEAHLPNLNLTLTALRDTLLHRPAGTALHNDTRRINTNTTTTVVNADAYLATMLAVVSNAGAGWTLTVQTRDVTPRLIWPTTVVALGQLVVANFATPVLTDGGIDIVTAAGGPAGTLDLFTSYYT